jgi:predicted transcriptional regulator
MGNKIVYDMTISESLIMEYLWKEESGKSFTQIMDFLINEAGKEWKKQTVNTFLKRLTDKGLIAADKKGNIMEYTAAFSKKEYEKGRAKKLLNDFYDGSFNAFLTALTGGQKIDKAFADELRNIVDKEV